MRLKNKKTGEIGNLIYRGLEDERIWVWIDNVSKPEYRYNSLAELNEEWEDYEEPKEYWYIDYNGTVKCFQYLDFDWQEEMKEIGNYFGSEEEAKQAVEKLKALKRLKDKGFRFVGVRGIGKVIDFDMPKPYHHVAFDEYNANEDELEFYNDLMLLFGGGE